MIHTPHRYFIFIFILLTTCTYQAPKCTKTQKALYMSFNALGKRDTLNNMFDEINTKIQRFNVTYQENNTVFTISNMHPQMYYSSHHQDQKFAAVHKVKVVLGDIQFAFRMDYSTKTGDEEPKKGWARGRVLMDQQKTFIKTLVVIDNQLEWQPQDIDNLTASRQLEFDFADPQFTDTQKYAYSLLINDFIGPKNLKSSIIDSFNSHYQQTLKTHLNSQKLSSNEPITYKYKNSNNIQISIDYLNQWRAYQISDQKQKGLTVHNTFEIQNHTYDCTQADIQFDQNQYGGLQEVIAIAQFRNSLVYGLQQGLADVTVDQKWQTNSFQMYMGDLANSFNAALAYPPSDPFKAICKWDKKISDVKLQFFNDRQNQLYVSFGQQCTVQHNSTNLFSFTADIVFIVNVYPQQQSLDFKIHSANSAFPSFKAIDPKFKLTQQAIAKYSISQIVYGMNSSPTFGTGWKIYKRRFPSIKITKQFAIIFDPSQK